MRITTFTKGARLTGDARVMLRADLEYRYVEQRKPIRVLAAETGRSYGAVHAMLAEAGVLRTKGGKPQQASTP